MTISNPPRLVVSPPHRRLYFEAPGIFYVIGILNTARTSVNTIVKHYIHELFAVCRCADIPQCHGEFGKAHTA